MAGLCFSLKIIIRREILGAGRARAKCELSHVSIVLSLVLGPLSGIQGSEMNGLSANILGVED